MDSQARGGGLQQTQKLFHSLYARFLSQGLDPNDAVARALLEMQEVAAGATASTSVSTVTPTQKDVKMEDATHLHVQKGSPSMAAKTELASTSASATGSLFALVNATAASSLTTTKSDLTTRVDENEGSLQACEALLGLLLERTLTLAIETDDFRVAKRLVYQVFSDPNALSAAFLKENLGKAENEVNAQWWGIDREQMLRVFTLLHTAMAGSDREAMQNTFRNALERLVTQPWNVCSTWHTPRALRFFLVLFEHPLMFDPDYLHVVGGLCRLFYYLSKDAKALVRAQWMAFFSSDELHRLLDILQQAITVCLYGSRKMDLVYAACGVLAELNVVNQDRMKALEPFALYHEFYNEAINSEMDLVEDYSRSIIFWKKRRAATRAAARVARREGQRLRHFNDEENELEERDSERGNTEERQELMPERQLSEMSLCDFPFVLDAASKSKVLQIDSDLEQRARAHDVVLSQSNVVVVGVESPFLILKIRRENLVEDAMQQIVHLSTSAETLKKPLKIKFVGEEGIDEGGVRKEFFQLLIRQLLDPAYGMFTYDEETHTLWFNSDSLEATMEYELIGTLLGLAIYNAVILDVSFPHIVYKKLMNCTLGLKDLELALPDLGRGLRQLLDFKGDIEEVYQRTFEYSYEIFGEVKTVELKPEGSSIPVNTENRNEYVALYVDYVLDKSVARQYAAFHHGFHQVCNHEVLSMFRWEELQLLICGSTDLDFEALEAVTHYEDGFTKVSEIIRDFWVIVHAFPLEDKKKLLRFATGSDRVPIRGLSNLAFVISRNGPDSERLPTAHTWYERLAKRDRGAAANTYWGLFTITSFNHLLLPEYSSREKLKERLLLAINQAEGFGLR